MPRKDRTFSHKDVLRIYLRHLSEPERLEVKRIICQSDLDPDEPVEDIDPWPEQPPEILDPSDPALFIANDYNAPMYRQWKYGNWTHIWGYVGQIINMFDSASNFISTVETKGRGSTLTELRLLTQAVTKMMDTYRSLVLSIDTVRRYKRREKFPQGY